MKKLIGKSGIDKIVFSSRNCIDKTEIVGKAKNANEFNKLFVNIGP